MRSIEELSAESARAIEGVVFDVDDTLTNGGVVEQEAYAALFRLRDAGLARIAVTGRPLGWMESVALMWPIDLAVGENGAGWIWRAPDNGNRRGRPFARLKAPLHSISGFRWSLRGWNTVSAITPPRRGICGGRCGWILPTGTETSSWRRFTSWMAITKRRSSIGTA